MAWMPGDFEAAGAAAGMAEVYGRPADTALAITPDVGRRDSLDKVILSRLSGDRIRVVVLQRVGDEGTESAPGIWCVADAFAICPLGVRDPLLAVRSRIVDTLDRVAAAAERWCRLGVWS